MRTLTLSLLFLLLWGVLVFGYSAFLCARLDSLIAQAKALTPTSEDLASLTAEFTRVRPYLALAVEKTELASIQALLSQLYVCIGDPLAFSQAHAQLLLCFSSLRDGQSLSWESFL